MAAGILTQGISLFPKRKKFKGRLAVLLTDGRIEVDGVAYARPTEAATAIVGKRTNGWGFFLIDEESKQSLRRVRQQYVRALSVDEKSMSRTMTIAMTKRVTQQMAHSEQMRFRRSRRDLAPGTEGRACRRDMGYRRRRAAMLAWWLIEEEK